MLELAIEGFEKPGSGPTVGGPMVTGQRGLQDWAYAEQSVFRPWLFCDAAEPEDGDLRRVDHAKDGFDPEVAETCDCDGAFTEFRTAQATVAGPGD